ncbi:MAG: PDDEXK nuclease domain-containing protein [Acidobacteriaceae bacterium]|jgi:predicted nuclease of restriction endonuclease-like (RecB) superfamily|nr:PDDEXK nuclease domain-containing protein [Acidobacteriaceae bacterium]
MTTRKKQSSARAKKVSVTRRGSRTLAPANNFAALVDRVVTIIEDARSRVIRTVNSEMVLLYWHIGREIVEYIQRGDPRAEYGEEVIENLSNQLQSRVGRGYSSTNLRYFRAFYIAYRSRRPKIRHIGRGEFANAETVDTSGKIRHTRSGVSLASLNPAPLEGFSSALGWTHYRALMKVEPAMVRTFYEIEAEREHWPVEHLERQIHTQLHLRLLKSRDKDGVMELARRGQTVEKPVDLMKSPVVLDFLGLQGGPALRESDIESAIISKLSQFLLELGKGFAFVARQKRITFEDEDFFVDLVFYNIILKCYLLVDLKLGKLTHQDVGQMDSYVRLFDAQGRTPGAGPTIGLILCAEKNEAMARYSILSEHKQLFAAKYVTYLPTEQELRQELERNRRIAEAVLTATREEKPVKPTRGTRVKGTKGVTAAQRTRKRRTSHRRSVVRR